MKSVQLVIVLFFLSAVCLSQNLIINDNFLGGEHVPFHDTAISWYNYVDDSYFIDLDSDNVGDAEVFFSASVGGPYHYRGLEIVALNQFLVHTNSDYWASEEYLDSNNQVQSHLVNYTVVQKYLSNDTIYYDKECRAQSTTILRKNYTDYGVSVNWVNVDYIIGDTCFIAFSKEVDGKISLYQLELEVSESVINLISVKTNDPEETEISNVYPNPTSHSIFVNKGFHEVEVYSVTGQYVFAESSTQLNYVVDVSTLASGVYFSWSKEK